MSNTLLEEFRKGLSGLKPREKGDPFWGEIIRTFEEAARVIGVSRMSLFRYREMLGDFPPLPTFKIALRWWKQKHGLPRKRGPLPGQRSKMVVFLREEQGLTFAEIGRRLGIQRASAFQLWKRHLQTKLRLKD
jgi:DNA-binding XRE family transcriptional regulator